jgi:hypothetical protein
MSWLNRFAVLLLCLSLGSCQSTGTRPVGVANTPRITVILPAINSPYSYRAEFCDNENDPIVAPLTKVSGPDENGECVFELYPANLVSGVHYSIYLHAGSPAEGWTVNGSGGYTYNGADTVDLDQSDLQQ